MARLGRQYPAKALTRKFNIYIQDIGNRYWVPGGDGNTNNSNNWALGSGGIGGASVPTNTTNVFFDANSGAGTATVNASLAVKNLNFTGFAGTLAGSNALEVKGSLTFGGGMTVSYSGNITMTATDSQTMTFNGKEIAVGGNWTFNGTGGTWTLQDNWSVANSNGNITLTAGTLNTNGKTLTNVSSFNISGTATRTLTLGASTVTVELQWVATDTTNLTFNANTSVIDVVVGAIGFPFAGGGLTYNEVKLRSNGRPNEMTGTNTFAILRVTPFSGHGGLILYANQTVTGTLEITGLNQRTGRVLVQSDTLGTARTITCAGTVSITNADFRDFTAAGAAAGWGTGTSVGNCFGNTGVTFTGAVTRYWVHPATASQTLYDNNWASSSGGAAGASFPLPQDIAVFDVNSFGAAGKTVTIPTATEWTARMSHMQWSGIINAPTFTFNNALECYGDFILATGTTINGTSGVTFLTRGAANIGTGGNTMTASIVVQAIGGVLTQTNAFTSSAAITLTNGEWSDGGQNLTAFSFNSSNSNVRAITKILASTWELTGTGTVWNLATTTNLTYTKGASTIKITDTSGSSKTFSGGGLTYYNIWWATGPGTGSDNIIIGNNTFNQFKSDVGIILKATTGSVQTASDWQISGSLGNINFVSSTTGGTHTLVKGANTTTIAKVNGVAIASVIRVNNMVQPPVVSLDYLNITNSIASPAATFYAGINSVNNGGNTDWTFGIPTQPGLNKIFGAQN